MIHPSETDTADVNEFGAVCIPEEILRKLGAGVGDLISFVKDGDSIRLVVKNKIDSRRPTKRIPRLNKTIPNSYNAVCN